MKFLYELQSATMASILKELYSFYLEPKDQAKYDLISKYRRTVSYRLIKEYYRLHAKGTVALNPHLTNLIYEANPLLKMIPKQEFSGKYYPISLIYGEKPDK